jgi:UDP-glucose 4-epimerase
MRLDTLHIVVTGGMGYVGSHVAKTLKAAGARVSIVDRRFNPHVMKFCDYFVQSEYNDATTIRNFKNQHVHGFVHCAGTSLVGPSITDPWEYYNNNVVKTIDLLGQLIKWPSKPFVVFSSSAAVYGTPDSVPIHEDHRLLPISPYGRTKLMIEQILSDYYTAYGLRSIALRYFNAAGADVWDSELGPEPNDTHLIPKIFESYHNNSVFEINGNDFLTGDGSCVRDYVHVSDLALAHAKCCDLLVETQMHDTINLGTANGISNIEMVSAFTNGVGPVQFEFSNKRIGDPAILIAANNKATEVLGWSPVYSDAATLINSTKQWYKKGVC